MEIKIQAKDFQEAIDLAFRNYGIQTHEILDFNESEGEFTFEVNKTIDSEVKLNAEVQSLVSSNAFTCNDIAFICNDGKVHTPDGGNLFDRIKVLLNDGLVPMVGFANFIDASDTLAGLNEGLTQGPVVYEDLILTKEGSLLKGSKFKSFRKNNSRQSDPVFDIEIDCIDAKKIEPHLNATLEKLQLDAFCTVTMLNGKLIVSPTMQCPAEVFNLLLMYLHESSGIKRLKISNGTYTLRGDMK
jgi:hypothetical protein